MVASSWAVISQPDSLSLQSLFITSRHSTSKTQPCSFEYFHPIPSSAVLATPSAHMALVIHPVLSGGPLAFPDSLLSGSEVRRRDKGDRELTFVTTSAGHRHLLVCSVTDVLAHYPCCRGQVVALSWTLPVPCHIQPCLPTVTLLQQPHAVFVWCTRLLFHMQPLTAYNPILSPNF